MRTPSWSNVVKTTDSGREFARAAWSAPRWSYKLSYEVLHASNGEYQQLVGFFNKHQGNFDTWLYLDPDDNSVTDQQIAIGDGTTLQFQLLRSLGGMLEPIYEPFASGPAPTVKVNGVTKTAGTDYSIGANGLLTFVVAPATSAIVAWSGSFYWRCRFKQSSVEFEQFMKNLWSLRTLEFITVKP